VQRETAQSKTGILDSAISGRTSHYSSAFLGDGPLIRLQAIFASHFSMSLMYITLEAITKVVVARLKNLSSFFFERSPPLSI
jgi:hypothetical protein